ncbi:MAG TPA: YceD family protein [Acidimicrobiia bacterium]|jgi:uncharacterized protein
MSELRIDVADLLAHPGARRDVTVSAEIDALRGTAAVIEGPVGVRASLERISHGIVVRGEVTARWAAQCSACLRALEQNLTVHVDELFEPSPVEGETYPLEGHELDLEQLVRDAVLLELPLAPHCDPPCGPDAAGGASRPEDGDPDEATDPRWAPLAELEL